MSSVCQASCKTGYARPSVGSLVLLNGSIQRPAAGVACSARRNDPPDFPGRFWRFLVWVMSRQSRYFPPSICASTGWSSIIQRSNGHRGRRRLRDPKTPMQPWLRGPFTSRDVRSSVDKYPKLPVCVPVRSATRQALGPAWRLLPFGRSECADWHRLVVAGGNASP